MMSCAMMRSTQLDSHRGAAKVPRNAGAQRPPITAGGVWSPVMRCARSRDIPPRHREARHSHACTSSSPSPVPKRYPIVPALSIRGEAHCPCRSSDTRTCSGAENTDAARRSRIVRACVNGEPGYPVSPPCTRRSGRIGGLPRGVLGSPPATSVRPQCPRSLRSGIAWAQENARPTVSVLLGSHLQSRWPPVSSRSYPP